MGNSEGECSSCALGTVKGARDHELGCNSRFPPRWRNRTKDCWILLNSPKWKISNGRSKRNKDWKQVRTCTHSYALAPHPIWSVTLNALFLMSHLIRPLRTHHTQAARTHTCTGTGSVDLSFKGMLKIPTIVFNRCAHIQSLSCSYNSIGTRTASCTPHSLVYSHLQTRCHHQCHACHHWRSYFLTITSWQQSQKNWHVCTSNVMV